MAMSDEKHVVVGILGGGQLGRMLCQASHSIGITCAVLDPAGEKCSAAHVAHIVKAGDFKNEKDIEAFVDEVKPHVLTVEIEHVNVDVLFELREKKGKKRFIFVFSIFYFSHFMFMLYIFLV